MLTVDQAGRVVLGRRLFTGLNWTIHPGNGWLGRSQRLRKNHPAEDHRRSG